MIEFVSYNFASQQNDRLYILQMQPGSPFDEIQAALDECKAHFVEMKAKEDAKKAAAEATAPIETVEAELVE